MKLQVLKPFAYRPAGFGGVDLEAGAVLEVRDDLAEGLVKEGYAKPADGKASPPKPAGDTGGKATGEKTSGDNEVEIPADWEDLKWPELQKLAAQLTDAKIKNKEDAVAAVRLELEHRAKGRA